MNLADDPDLPIDHPEAACYYDLGTRTVILNSGDRAPVTGLCDVDGEPLEEEDLDLCDEFVVQFGPTPSGKMLHVLARSCHGSANRPRHA